MIQKIIRDPVHDVIALEIDQPTDRLLFALINTREFQRLRRIRQLGMAALAYPGADHSRYSHGLGVMATARKILDQLGRSFYIAVEDRRACLAAALLHDLGHGPFSHVFERVSGLDHEQTTRRVLLDPRTQVHGVLRDASRDLPQRVVDLLHGQGPRGFLHDILSSQLDADRLDYLLRDNLMTGSQYGGYDLAWLAHAMTIDEASQRLCVAYKGVSAVEAYLQSRYHMYRNVYFHKVVRSAEGMLLLALRRAARLLAEGRLQTPGASGGVQEALSGRAVEEDAFLDLDDVAVLQCFKQWRHGEDQRLAGLCDGLLYRRLFKTIDLSDIDDAAQVRAMVEAVAAAIDDAGAESAYHFFYDEPADTPYAIEEEGHSAGEEIRVRGSDGRLTEFARLSPLVLALNRQLTFRRIHVDETYAALARRVVEGMR